MDLAGGDAHRLLIQTTSMIDMKLAIPRILEPSIILPRLVEYVNLQKPAGAL